MLNHAEKELPLISVIIPIYNGERHLDSCLKSVCAQTYSNLEIILVNDGSTDRSEQLCKLWQEQDHRIVVLNQRNQGPAAARNAGLDACRGSWVAFADCDDQVAPDMYEYLLGLAEKYSAQIAQCGIQAMEGARPRGNWFCAPAEQAMDAFLPELTPREFDLISYSLVNKLYCRTWLGTRRLSEQLKIGEDLAFNLGLLEQHCRLAAGREAKYLYQIHEASLSHSPPDLECLTGTHRALDQVQNDLQAQNEYSALILDEKLRDCLDVCSKLARARNPEWTWLAKEMRGEIARQYGYILAGRRFSLFEKGKFTLIRFFWPVYRFVIPAYHCFKQAAAGKLRRKKRNEAN